MGKRCKRKLNVSMCGVNNCATFVKAGKYCPRHSEPSAGAECSWVKPDTLENIAECDAPQLESSDCHVLAPLDNKHLDLLTPPELKAQSPEQGNFEKQPNHEFVVPEVSTVTVPPSITVDLAETCETETSIRNDELVACGLSLSSAVAADSGFLPLAVEEQKRMCTVLGLPFVKQSMVSVGTSFYPLTEDVSVEGVRGDGNCLFSSLSMIVTGVPCYDAVIRAHICDTLCVIENDIPYFALLRDNGYVSQYLQRTKMRRSKVWGTDLEIFAACYLLNVQINVLVYNLGWMRFAKLNTPQDALQTTLYLRSNHSHFEPIIHVQRGTTEPAVSDTFVDDTSVTEIRDCANKTVPLTRHQLYYQRNRMKKLQSVKKRLNDPAKKAENLARSNKRLSDPAKRAESNARAKKRLIDPAKKAENLARANKRLADPVNKCENLARSKK